MMRLSTSALSSCAISALLLWLRPSVAQTLQLGSSHNVAAVASETAGGDSWAPIVSADGRYVLFASTADNLVANTNQSAQSAASPGRFNVYLRDRQAASTTLVSVNSSGISAANGDSFPCGISTNGHYALFESIASDLVQDDSNGLKDVFVRDLVRGTTLLVSVNTNGQSGRGVSRSPAMSRDGRFITFVSSANDLVAGDTNGIADVFLRDLQTGTTVLASVGAMAASPAKAVGPASSENPEVTDDGRYVAFLSTATNLAPNVPIAGDIYVRDLVAGTNIWASAGARTAAQDVLKTTNIVCYNVAMSSDGQYIAFEVSSNTTANSTVGLILRYHIANGSTDLVWTNAAVQPGPYVDIHSLDMTPDGRLVVFVANANDGTGNSTCVYLWDSQTGTNILASANLSGGVATNSTCDWPTIDASSRYVAFLSSAPDLVTNALSGAYHLYSRDLQAGTTELIDADTNGVGSLLGPETTPRLSADGRFIAFECPDGNLVSNDRNRGSDVFVRDMLSGSTGLVSARARSLPSLSGNGSLAGSPPSLSADGRFVVFASDAEDLVENDSNARRDIFLRDQFSGDLLLASVGTNGLSGNGGSSEGSISEDGRYIAFSSLADNLVPGDTNSMQDVFLYDRLNQQTTLVSLNAAGTGPANRASYSPVLTGGSKFVLFRSQASNLGTGSFSGENLFVRNMETAKTLVLTRTGLYFVGPSSGERFVPYIDMNGPGSGKLYVWDAEAGAVIYTNGALGISSGAMSPQGNRMVFWAGSGISYLFATDLVQNTNWAIVSGLLPGGRSSLRFDRAGNKLAYTALLNRTNQVYLYDFQTGSNVLVSQSFDGTAPGNGDSDSVEFSAEGRFIAYRSAATNLVRDDTNNVPDLFLFDTQSGINTLLSSNPSGGFPNNRSLLPSFSGNGRTICFQSWATDLAQGDYNQVSDLFVYSLFYAEVQPDSDGFWVSWPAADSKNYRVEFKDALADTTWQQLNGTITNAANKAYLKDPDPKPFRVYRVRTF